MRELFFRVKYLSVVSIIASAIIGCVLLAKPEEGVYTISMIIGGALIVLGIAAWIFYLVGARSAFLAVMGTLTIIGGIVVCFAYKAIASIIILVLGVWLIISGVVNMLASFDSKHFILGTWLVSFIMSLIMIGLGVGVVSLSGRSDMVVGTLLGASLLFYAVTDSLALIEVIRKAKKVKEKYKQAQQELENAMNQFEETAQEFDNSVNAAAGNAEEFDSTGTEIE